jgi:predicted lipoprotein
MAQRPSMPLILAAAAPAARAGTPRQAQIALAVTDAFVIPIYRRLADAAKRNETGWQFFKDNRLQGSFATVRAGYNQLADVWAQAQTIKMGPISLFLRSERFAYWPEARNATTRALETLLASRSPASLSPETLATNSVAAQGLTALERLLYDGADPAMALRAPGAAGAWRVEVGLGISRNLALIAQDVLNDWTAPNGVRAAIAANRGWNNLFASGTEAATLLLTDLVGAFRVMHDLKLLPVLGESIDVARPQMAEAWRSRRPARNLQLNLLAARDMERVFARGMRAQQQAPIDALFVAAERAINALPADMGEAAADPRRRQLVVNAERATRAVQVKIAEVLPPALGITLGFNALDGD